MSMVIGSPHDPRLHLERLAQRAETNATIPLEFDVFRQQRHSQLTARPKDSLDRHGGADPDALRKLTDLLRYVDGDYEDSKTFDRLRKELGDAKRPLSAIKLPRLSRIATNWLGTATSSLVSGTGSGFIGAPGRRRITYGLGVRISTGSHADCALMLLTYRPSTRRT